MIATQAVEAMHTSSPGPVVSIRSLEKVFGYDKVLKYVDLDLQRGHIIGLIGPNSGGKSTLLRHLVGIYLPTAGTCQVLGVEAGKLGDHELQRIGYVHQEAELIDWMSVEEIIRFTAAHYTNWNAEIEKTLLARFNLQLDDRVGLLSPGKRQKLSVLLAVCFEPELLILDEPASAMDPIARKDFLELLLSLIQDQNRTIIISSHILTDIEKVIDHVIVLDQGKILVDESFDELLEQYVRLDVFSPDKALPTTWPIKNIVTVEQDTNSATIIAHNVGHDLSAIKSQYNCRVSASQLCLEDIYPLIIKQQPKQ